MNTDYKPTTNEKHVRSKLEKRIKKATSKKNSRPKPKHINKIISYLREDGSGYLIEQCIAILIRRKDGGMSQSWAVKRKTLIVFHQILNLVPEFALVFGKRVNDEICLANLEKMPLTSKGSDLVSEYWHYLRTKTYYNYIINAGKPSKFDAEIDPPWYGYWHGILIDRILSFQGYFKSTDPLGPVVSQILTLLSRDLASNWKDYNEYEIDSVIPRVFKSTTVENCNLLIKCYDTFYLNRVKKMKGFRETVLKHTEERDDDDVPNLDKAVYNELSAMNAHLDRLLNPIVSTADVPLVPTTETEGRDVLDTPLIEF